MWSKSFLEGLPVLQMLSSLGFPHTPLPSKAYRTCKACLPAAGAALPRLQTVGVLVSRPLAKMLASLPLRRLRLLQVLASLGVPQERLTRDLLEVWNKTDLLQEPVGAQLHSVQAQQTELLQMEEQAQAAAAGCAEGDAPDGSPPGEAGAGQQARVPDGSTPAASDLEASAGMAEQAPEEPTQADAAAHIPHPGSWEGQQPQVQQQQQLNTAAAAATAAAQGEDGRLTGGVRPTMVFVSAKEGRGLEDLLLEIDRKVRSSCLASETLSACSPLAMMACTSYD